MQFSLQELRHAKFGAVGPMVFHGSCALRLRSRITTRSHFIAVRLSGLVTAAHRRTHPIALSYLIGGDLRFIAAHFSSVPSILRKRELVRVSAVLCNRHITFFGNELPLHFMTQENKRSFHYNCITSNRDSSCNETSDILPLGRLGFPSNVAHIKLVNHWKRTGRRPGRPLR